MDLLNPQAPLPDSQGTSFFITLLEGSIGNDQQTKTIELVGTMLPFKGVSFPTKMRSKTTNYPGNPVSTQQLFGAIKDNTTISGVWYDAALGNGVARALVKQVEYVCEHGLPVEVRWGGGATGGFTDIGIVRRGIIKSIDPKFEIPQIVNWTIEFEWRGDDIATTAPTFGAGPSAVANQAETFAALSDACQKALSALNSFEESAKRLISKGTGAMAAVNDALDTAQSAFANAAQILDSATSVMQSAAQLPADIAARVQGVCDRVVLSCMNVRAAYDACAGLWPMIEGLTGKDWIDAAKYFEVQAKTAKLALFPADDPLDQMDGMAQQFAILEVMVELSEQMAQQSAILASQTTPLIVAEERPPAGTDLRDLAAKWYGDAEDWVLIADFNDLDSSEVPATPTGPSDLGAPPILIPDRTAYAAMLAALWGAGVQDNSIGTTA